MDKNDRVWQEEQQRVNYVQDLIVSKIKTLEQEASTMRDDVVSMRKDFWDEVTVNFSEADDLGETSTSLRQQSQVLSQREKSHQHTFAALDKMKRLKQSPYFARIDFEEEGEPAESIYLGIASLLEDDDQQFLIYDWRAPISNLYYDSVPGETSYETPSGTISGEMTLKRQFVIHNRKIKVMFDTGVTIGDELLQEVLGQSSDAQMRSIVATIQKEQNLIIRNDRSRLLVVQGAAGSGKTSAALQRVAYLLYKHRGNLTADQVILFSPNPMFNSYVSSVLPELGEENMQQSTFQEYLERRLGREFQLEDPFEQIEYVLANDANEAGYVHRMSGIRYKSSVDYLHAITNYKSHLESSGMLFRPVRFQGKVIVSRAELTKRFYEFDPAITLANRCELLKEWVLKELAQFTKEEAKEAWVDEYIQYLSNEDYQRAYSRMRRKQHGTDIGFEDYESERDILAKMVVSRHMKPLRKWIKGMRFVDIVNLYKQIFKKPELIKTLSEESIPQDWSQISEATLSKMDKKELFYEDATPYLYLRELVLGFRSNNSIRHVIIDEAQDYSPFQLYFMKRLFPRAKVTALGDFNQAIYAHSSVLQQSELIGDIYGEEETELITLTQSYRSTKEIVEFTSKMVEHGEHIKPFNRGGEKPELYPMQDVPEMLNSISKKLTQLEQQGFESMAVICKTASEAKAVHEQLSAQHEAKLIKKTTLSFEKGIHIIPAYLAKGVEFDAVLIYNGSNESYTRESERKLFYTACTRAMHLLDIFYVGEPSRFMLEASPLHYKMITDK